MKTYLFISGERIFGCISDIAPWILEGKESERFMSMPRCWCESWSSKSYGWLRKGFQTKAREWKFIKALQMAFFFFLLEDPFLNEANQPHTELYTLIPFACPFILNELRDEGYQISSDILWYLPDILWSWHIMALLPRSIMALLPSWWMVCSCC